MVIILNKKQESFILAPKACRAVFKHMELNGHAQILFLMSGDLTGLCLYIFRDDGRTTISNK